MKAVRVKSPAKINLGLKVIKKRADEYHDIETIFQMINLYDVVILRESSDRITLCSDNNAIPLDERNLAYRAAQTLREKIGIKKGVKIEIYKHIPISAGLGGGSSNAAVTLVGLNYLWDLNLSPDDLLPLASSLGADVPFFLAGPTAMGKGRGDELQNLHLKSKFYVILINSGLTISTKWVYDNIELKLTKNGNDIKILKFMFEEDEIEKGAGLLFNDLESVVAERYSIINEMKEALLSAGALGASMSGSGSTVFGIFKDCHSAERAYENLKREKWTLFLTENLTSRVYPEEVIV